MGVYGLVWTQYNTIVLTLTYCILSRTWAMSFLTFQFDGPHHYSIKAVQSLLEDWDLSYLSYLGARIYT